MTGYIADSLRIEAPPVEGLGLVEIEARLDACKAAHALLVRATSEAHALGRLSRQDADDACRASLAPVDDLEREIVDRSAGTLSELVVRLRLLAARIADESPDPEPLAEFAASVLADAERLAAKGWRGWQQDHGAEIGASGSARGPHPLAVRQPPAGSAVMAARRARSAPRDTRHSEQANRVRLNALAGVSSDLAHRSRATQRIDAALPSRHFTYAGTPPAPGRGVCRAGPSWHSEKHGHCARLFKSIL